MNLEKLLTRLVFGERVKGERVKEDYELRHSVTYPHGGARQSEAEWRKEFKVGLMYSRFDSQGNFYEQGDDKEGNVLKMILTGSI